LIRAITGTGKLRTASQARCVLVAEASAWSRSNSAISARLVPPTKERSPAPVITTARRLSSCFSCVMTSMKRSFPATPSALRFVGLLKVTRAMRPASPRSSYSSSTSEAGSASVVAVMGFLLLE